jgi:glycosyltransferase involved in cell wall biosynthesis
VMDGGRRIRVLIPIAEAIGGQMSAVGIRKLEVGRALAATCDVTFATTATTNDPVAGLRIVDCPNRRAFRSLLASHDVIYTLGLTADRFLDVVRSGIRVVLDMYTPLAVEIVEAFPEAPPKLLRRMHRRVVRWTIAQFAHSDFIVCTGAAQRDLWIGTLNAAGLLDPERMKHDPDCRGIIDFVPMGVPVGEPVAAGSPLRDRLPSIGPNDFVLLWSSHILAWQDPETLLHAMARLAVADPTIRLVFLGTGTPKPKGRAAWLDPAAARTRETFALAEKLGLRDSNVFFLPDRIPYRDIGAFYCDADAGIATYPASLETRYCLGTRLLDFLWSGLPMVVSGMDLQREFVEERGLGIFAKPHDPDGLADAILRMKSAVRGGEFQAESFAAARRALSWPLVTEPVARFCQSPLARSRKPRRRMLMAVGQLLEFCARSVLCRLTREFTWEKRQ